MKKEIRETKNGIVQITTFDERWYAKSVKNPDTGLPEYKFVPSVTWIADYFPKGIGFYKWLGNKGWDEAEALKIAAGEKGSKVHQAISELIEGKEVKMDAKYLNKTTEKEEELSVEEYEAILSFAKWFKVIKPKVKFKEMVVFNDRENYAGTVDLICEIDKELWIVDFKTSPSIWPSFELQLSAYKHALGEDDGRLAILQVGYRKNKNGYKFTEIEDKYPLFLATKQIWANECEGISPSQKDYPLSISLGEIKVAVKKVNSKLK